jgi:hypothetical protein
MPYSAKDLRARRTVGARNSSVLPVTFDRDDEPEVALVIVLDRSWSMNGAPMEPSKAAAVPRPARCRPRS